jgi:hypothetical protein
MLRAVRPVERGSRHKRLISDIAKGCAGAVTGAGAVAIGAGAVVTGAAATGAAVTGKVTLAASPPRNTPELI